MKSENISSTGKYILIVLSFIFIMVNCEKLPDKPAHPDNPLDPNNPNYNRPIITINSGPIDNEIVLTDTIIFTWEGNQKKMEFRTKLDSNYWTEYSRTSTVTFTKLADDVHYFNLQGRFSTGEESDTLTTMFIVDAINIPSLQLIQREVLVDSGGIFAIELRAEEIDSITAISTKILFDNNFIKANQVAFISDSTAFFLRNGGQLINFSQINNEIGTVNIDCAVAENLPHYISGSGKIARIYFKHILSDSIAITISGESKFRNHLNEDVAVTNLLGAEVIIRKE